MSTRFVSFNLLVASANTEDGNFVVYHSWTVTSQTSHQPTYVTKSRTGELCLQRTPAGGRGGGDGRTPTHGSRVKGPLSHVVRTPWEDKHRTA